MDSHEKLLRTITRRHFFHSCATGVGAAALATLLNGRLPAAPRDPLARQAPHFAPKAKRVIYLFMAGAPSQLDLFDSKPKLRELNGRDLPEELLRGERFAFIKGVPKLLGSPYEFSRAGECGAELSELLPHTREIVDDIAIVRSMVTDVFNHAPAQLFLNTGFPQIGRPSMGSWLTYGLGSEASDLPGFVVMISGGGQPSGGTSCWSSGFLPTLYQGVRFRSQGDPILFLSNPPGLDGESRREALDALRDLNRLHHQDVGDPEIETRIASFEMAYRMQTSAPELIDISSEPESVHEMYGTKTGKVSFANNCLLARRLVERGVRFVQLYHRGWDNHGTNPGDDILHQLPKMCRETDQAAAALIRDLKQRGLLDETLVIWGGEFGRTPMNEERNGSKFLGRDHHPRAFTIWLAGGGVRGGITHGATDELGYNVVESAVHVHDLQATVLHLLGLDHTKLTYKFQGRDFRLTDVGGKVVRELLA
jgi:hypothetical protein